MSAQNKDCRCTINDVMHGTRKCRHGWEFDIAVTAADVLRTLVERVRKLSRSSKVKELLDEMIEQIDEIEDDAQGWYDDWESECEGRAEDQKEAEEQEKRDDECIREADEALSLALADREKLLARVGLTDSAWVLQGGAAFAHMRSRFDR